MALCHDERAFAMGFTRRNPHAGNLYPYDSSERETVQVRKRYIESLTPARRRAFDEVRFCFVAIGKILEEQGAMPNISPKDLHRLFSPFAKALGLRGPFYNEKNGRCKAVSIYLDDKPVDPENLTYWLIDPYTFLASASESDKKRASQKKVLKAARIFCNSWLPGWDF